MRGWSSYAHHNLESPLRIASSIGLSLLLACGDLLSGDAGDGPGSMETCLAMDAGDERDKCMEDTIVATFQANEEEGQRIIREEVDNPQLQDFLWYIVTKQYNPKSDQYCREIQTKALSERCRSIVQRPHLHREMGDQSGKAGAGGGPAPGGGGGPQPQ